MAEQTDAAADVFSRICETSTRLMAGTVPRRTLQDLQKKVRTDTGSYPWEVVVDRVLLEPFQPDELTRRALRSQRDWIARGGRETPGRGARHHAKTFVARLVAALVFMGIFIPVVVVVLVMIKHKWPDADVYRLLDWLREGWPSVFAR